MLTARLVLAPKHDSHAVCGAHPAGLSDLVPCELLPDGLQWVASRQHIRCSQGSSLDDWLRGISGPSAGDTYSDRPCTVHRVNGYLYFGPTGFGVSWSCRPLDENASGGGGDGDVAY